MRIAIYDYDRYFSDRICNVMNKKYGSLAKWTALNENQLINIKEDKSDVILLPLEMKNDMYNDNEAIIYFSEKKIDGICNWTYKYQTASSLNEAISQIYKAKSLYRTDEVLENCKLISFISLGGGMGNSTMATGASQYYAREGKKVLYLNLKTLGGTGYFDIEGSASIYQIVQDISKKQGNLNRLVEGIRIDPSGIFVAEGNVDPEKYSEILSCDFLKILCLVQKIGKFDNIIIDAEISHTETFNAIIKNSDSICFILDGSELGNKKFQWVLPYLSNIDNLVQNKIRIIFNKYRIMPKVRKEMEASVIGGLGYVEGSSYKDVLAKIHNMNLWARL